MSQSAPSTPLSLPRLYRAATQRRDENPPWSLHLATAAFGLVIVLTILNPLMTINNDGTQSLIREVGYAVALAMALIATRPWRRPERLLVVPWPLLLALGWCWLSMAWALDPGVGMRRLALTTIVVWTLFALVRLMGVERTVAVLRLMLIILLAVNFLVVFIDPATGIHPAHSDDLTGNWRGLMAHKNFAGITCAFTILFMAFDAAAMPVAVRAVVAAAAAAFLWLTDSATSMGMCVAALIGGVTFGLVTERIGPRRLGPPALAWGLLGIAAGLFASMAINNGPYLDMVSDPAGFTGRTQIWTALIKAYVDQPWLGLGFGSFWDLGPSGPVFTYARGWVTGMSEGHNSYLDLLVQIGALGTLLVLFAMVVWPAQRLLSGGIHPVRSLVAAVLLFGVGHNFTESMLFDRDGLVQVFMMVAIALLWEATAAPASGASRLTKKPAADTERPRAPLRL